MRKIKPKRKAKLKYEIKTSRDEGRINGKNIEIEKEYTVGEFLDMPYDKFTIAIANFVIRRTDYLDERNEERKIYYGHVGLFGYYVAEDEISKWYD